MKSLLRWILPVVVLAAGFLGARWLIASRPEVETQRSELPPPLVRTLVARSAPHRLSVEANGSVRPRAELRLAAEVEGRVVAVAPGLVAGAFVEAGEALVEIDRRDFELALVRARGEVARARAALEREQAEADVAREQWRDLGRGEASPLALREPQLAEARANVQAAEAALARAELDLERATLRAPFDARVRRESVDVGAFLARGAELAVLYPVDRVEVALAVPDEDLFALDLSPGGAGEPPPVLLEADYAGALRTWEGRVVRTEGEVDPRTRMVTLVAEVADPFGRATAGNGAQAVPGTPLEIGLFVRARILGRTLEDVFVLPRAALRGPSEVFVIDDDERLRVRAVEVVRAEREDVVVADGLRDGERVCLSPLEAPVEGMRVRVADEPVGAEVQR